MEKEFVAEVKKILFLNGKSYKDMAAEIGVSYGYLRLVMTGREKGEGTIRKIRDYVEALQTEACTITEVHHDQNKH